MNADVVITEVYTKKMGKFVTMKDKSVLVFSTTNTRQEGKLKNLAVIHS